jgi:hypothetical protein
VAVKECRISNVKAVFSGGVVIISWHPEAEVNLKSYIVERINAGTGASDRANMPEPNNVRGANNNYSVTDDQIFDDLSFLTYNIYANFLDNTTILLPNGYSIPVTIC